VTQTVALVLGERLERLLLGQRLESLRVGAVGESGRDLRDDVEEVPSLGRHADPVAETPLGPGRDLPADAGDPNDRIRQFQDTLDILEGNDLTEGGTIAGPRRA
jgi:hypothetical protein